MSTEWTHIDTDPSEGYCRLQYFGIKKQQSDGEVEFIITLREYIHAPDPAMKFFAQTDKQTNQKTAPFTPVGWGATVSAALHGCIKAIRRFPYEPAERVRD
jgi:hypothetical protein